MTTTRKRETAKTEGDSEQEAKPAPVMCDNHPDVKAAHTTTTKAHAPISLCRACLRRMEYMKER